MTLIIKQFSNEEAISADVQYLFVVEDDDTEESTVLLPGTRDKHRMYQYNPPAHVFLFQHREIILTDLSLSGTFNTLDQFGYF